MSFQSKPPSGQLWWLRWSIGFSSNGCLETVSPTVEKAGLCKDRGGRGQEGGRPGRKHDATLAPQVFSLELERAT